MSRCTLLLDPSVLIAAAGGAVAALAADDACAGVTGVAVADGACTDDAGAGAVVHGPSASLGMLTVDMDTSRSPSRSPSPSTCSSMAPESHCLFTGTGSCAWTC